jgi:hypothetical protein
MLGTYGGHAKPLCLPETLAHFTRLTPIPLTWAEWPVTSNFHNLEWFVIVTILIGKSNMD